MEIRRLTPEAVTRHRVDELPGLIADERGLLWVDGPGGYTVAVALLGGVFGFHARAVQDSVQRSPVPKVHVYADHVFVVLHAPEAGAGGHVHYVELDQFVGPRYVVTVHGPVNPAVDVA